MTDMDHEFDISQQKIQTLKEEASKNGVQERDLLVQTNHNLQEVDQNLKLIHNKSKSALHTSKDCADHCKEIPMRTRDFPDIPNHTTLTFGALQKERDELLRIILSIWENTSIDQAEKPQRTIKVYIEKLREFWNQALFSSPHQKKEYQDILKQEKELWELNVKTPLFEDLQKTQHSLKQALEQKNIAFEETNKLQSYIMKLRNDQRDALKVIDNLKSALQEFQTNNGEIMIQWEKLETQKNQIMNEFTSDHQYRRKLQTLLQKLTGKRYSTRENLEDVLATVFHTTHKQHIQALSLAKQQAEKREYLLTQKRYLVSQLKSAETWEKEVNTVLTTMGFPNLLTKNPPHRPLHGNLSGIRLFRAGVIAILAFRRFYLLSNKKPAPQICDPHFLLKHKRENKKKKIPSLHKRKHVLRK